MPDQTPLATLRCWYRTLRLARRMPLRLASACARLAVWPGEGDYDPATGWAHLSDFGLDLRTEADGSLLARADGLSFPVESREDLHTLADVLVQRIYGDLLDLNPGRDVCVWDIGMNLGAAALQFARQPRVTRVYAYEPFPHTFALAQRALALNPEPAAKVRAFEAGVGRAEGSLSVSYDPDMKASARTSTPPLPGASPLKMEKGETVRIVDAANVLRTIRSENAGAAIVVKMDCEGAEYEIVERLAEARLLDEIAAADIECHAGSAPIEDAFRKAGFGVNVTDTNTPGYVIVAARAVGAKS